MGNIKELRFWTYKILPLVYDDSLSYLEVLSKVKYKLNEVIKTTNELPDAISAEIERQLQGDGDVYKNLFSGIINAIATDEGDGTYTPNVKQGGELIWLNGMLYEVVQPMAVGVNYVIGTNIVPVSIDSELNNIINNISSHNEYWRERASANHDTESYFWWKGNLYKAVADIKVNDILAEQVTEDGTTTGNMLPVNTMDEITAHYLEMHEADNNLQTQIDGNDGDIEELQKKDTDLQKQITDNDNFINTRVNNIVAQSGNDNTEIVDARLGAIKLGNKTYQTLGDAIRNQLLLCMAQSEINITNDLNHLTTPNQYYYFDKEAENPTNVPIGIDVNNGAFTIFNIGYEYNSPSRPIFIRQFLFNYDGKIYNRDYNSNTWSNWNEFSKYIFNSYYPVEDQSVEPSFTDANDIFVTSAHIINTNKILNLPSNQGILITVNPKQLANLPNYLTTQIFIGKSFNYRFYLINKWGEWSSPINYKQILTTFTTAIEAENYSEIIPDFNNAIDSGVYTFNLGDITSGKNAPLNMPIYTSGRGTLFVIHPTPINTNSNYINYLTTQIFFSEYGIYERIKATETLGWNKWKKITEEKESLIATPSNILDVIENHQGETIYLQNGDYNIDEIFTAKYGADFWTNYTGYISAGEKEAGIVLHNGTKLIGNGNNVNIIFEYTGNNRHVIEEFSPLNMTSDCRISNIHIKTSNCRYHIHDDFGGWWGQTKEGINEIDHCTFEGDNKNHTAIGGGMYINSVYKIHDNLFLQTDNTFIDISYHNHINISNNKLFIKNNYGKGRIRILPYGDGTLQSYALITNNKCHSIEKEMIGDYGIDNITINEWNNSIDLSTN